MIETAQPCDEWADNPSQPSKDISRMGGFVYDRGQFRYAGGREIWMVRAGDARKQNDRESSP